MPWQLKLSCCGGFVFSFHKIYVDNGGRRLCHTANDVSGRRYLSATDSKGHEMSIRFTMTLRFEVLE